MRLGPYMMRLLEASKATTSVCMHACLHPTRSPQNIVLSHFTMNFGSIAITFVVIRVCQL